MPSKTVIMEASQQRLGLLVLFFECAILFVELRRANQL